MLDIENFIDYLIIEIYSQNTDWPINNWTVARERREGSKWRFYLWDVEGSFRSPPIWPRQTGVGPISITFPIGGPILARA
jgi:hypothetical protein